MTLFYFKVQSIISILTIVHRKVGNFVEVHNSHFISTFLYQITLPLITIFELSF